MRLIFALLLSLVFNLLAISGWICSNIFPATLILPVAALLGIYVLFEAFITLKSPCPSKEAALVEAAPQKDTQLLESVGNRSVLHFISSLQEKGRLVDFLMDDISRYSDEQVGAAARVVHQGCAVVLKEQLAVMPIHSGSEGEEFALKSGFNVAEWRLVGKVGGEAPFKGTVLHRGWKVERFNLVRDINLSQAKEAQSQVIAPAELEL